jgi:mannose-1-phosphate guanylyltransferase
MKAMILAAGKGTRVRPITYTTPKPMIPIMQKPVMEFLLELLRLHGFAMASVLALKLAIPLKAASWMVNSLVRPWVPPGG